MTLFARERVEEYVRVPIGDVEKEFPKVCRKIYDSPAEILSVEVSE
jgi:hypothetical protein